MTPIILLKKKGPPFIADKPDSFEGLVNGSTIVVDKSPFISHVFEAMQSEPKRQIYLPLPPAMGKTCLLSMFKSFVDVSFHGRDDREDVFATKFDEGLVVFCSLEIVLMWSIFHFFRRRLSRRKIHGSIAIYHQSTFISPIRFLCNDKIFEKILEEIP